MKKINFKKIKIVKAKVSDVPYIYKLVNDFARRNLMLPRVLNDIYERLYEFFVIKYVNRKKEVVIGCAALHLTWVGKENEVWGEVRSLAVEEKFQGLGLGKKLVLKCHQEAKKFGLKKMFALTYVPQFFLKLGYEIVPRDSLPHKVWTECINCPFFIDCKETPLVKNL
jgi:amino-acid N-acetyltransferase